MQRGDLVTVSLQGDYGKPRPALIVQSDLLTDLESVVLCPVTSDLRNAAFRVTVEPNPANGLRALSQVMVDKLSTLPRTKISEPFGRLDDERMKAIDRALLGTSKNPLSRTDHLKPPCCQPCPSHEAP